MHWPRPELQEDFIQLSFRQQMEHKPDLGEQNQNLHQKEKDDQKGRRAPEPVCHRAPEVFLLHRENPREKDKADQPQFAFAAGKRALE